VEIRPIFKFFTRFLAFCGIRPSISVRRSFEELNGMRSVIDEVSLAEAETAAD
jgi:hypothetical protein